MLASGAAYKMPQFLGICDTFACSDDLVVMLGVQEVAGSNPVVPTERDRKPFCENIERLSHCGD